MRCNRQPHPGILNVGNVKLPAGFLDDLTNGRIMHMRYFGKQVVLNLEIESANQCGNELIAGGEIGSGLQLVNCPLILQAVIGHIRHGKMRMLYSVSQLKHNAQYKTGK